MEVFTPGIFDRLLDFPVNGASGGTVPRIAIEDMKDMVARDLEAMLNTRNVTPDRWLKNYPECSRSIITYGLSDFAGRSLTSPDDRAYICTCLENAIAAHEPRLHDVKATLAVDGRTTNCLHFAIQAMLVVSSTQAPVSFDAVLQTSSLHYTINKERGATSSGV